MAVIAPGLWWLQILVATVVSVGTLLLLRPTLIDKVREPAGLPLVDRHDGRQLGCRGVGDHREGGEIKVAGQSWTARPSPGQVIDQGTEIEVYEVDGAIAVVYPKHGELP